ncbi:MAG TPA: GNAT family protein, partial [Solirubrobacteraceae bacterium]
AHVAFEFMGLERVGAYTNVLHLRSQAALRSLGFRQEGTLRHWHRHPDHVHDVVVWSILRSEWERSKLRLTDIEVTGELPAPFVLG